jgi:putative membrane protein
MTSNRWRAALWIEVALVVAVLAYHAFHVATQRLTHEFEALTAALTIFALLNATRFVGARGAALFFVVATVMGYGFEWVGVHHGVPFGPYHYTDVFGTRISGVPLVVPFAWFVVLWLTYVVTNLMLFSRPVAGGRPSRVVWLCAVGALVTIAYDLAADPFFTQRVGAWKMERQGSYFGEEHQAFWAWGLVSFSAILVIRLTMRLVRDDHAAPGTGRLAAALPVAAYAGWALFFSFAGEPHGTRLVASIAMGIPVVVAITGLVRWDPVNDARWD